MPKSTFPAYPDASGWNALLPKRVPKPSASGTIEAKYVVIGAGYTGFAAARRLHELDPAAEIVVLEATTVGEGASARNSGFITSADIATGFQKSAIQQNILRNRFVKEGFDSLMGLIKKHGIQCDVLPAGRIKGAATELGKGQVNDLLQVVKALDVEHVLLDEAELEKRIGTRYYKLGLFTKEGHLVQPAALIRGLADALPKKIQLFEQSPVLSMKRQGKWKLETPDARITADTVVMATNSAIKNFGYLRDRLVTIYTYAAITEAMKPDDAAQLGQMQSWGLLPSHRLGTTLRRVGSDRFLVRSLYGYESGISSSQAHSELVIRFNRRYPGLRHVKLEHTWGGVTALTMNGSPWWGKVDDQLYTSAGCNGGGIIKGTVLGKRLAEKIVGEPGADELLEAYGTADRIAPEPFRWVGFQVISRIEKRKAGLES